MFCNILEKHLKQAKKLTSKNESGYKKF